jgi:ABC-type lipoprotein export system ATPase subunit/ABC-type uncharacterized transport system permease subunit
MQDAISAFLLGVTYTLPVVVFGVLHRLGKRLDLSIDAQVAAGAVVMSLCMRSGLSTTAAVLAGMTAAVAVAGAGLVTTEALRVRGLVSTLLVSILTFRVLQLVAGESVTISGAAGRVHPFVADLMEPWPWVVGIGAREVSGAVVAALAIGVSAIVLGLWSRSRSGLMFRAVGDNPDLPMAWSAWQVRAVATVIGGALLGLGGALQADREAGFYSGFGMSTLVAAFVVSEATHALTTWAVSAAGKRQSLAERLAWTVSRVPVIAQLLIGGVLLYGLGYVLLRHTGPGVPEIAQVAILILLLGLLAVRQFRRLADPSATDRDRGLLVHGLSKAYRNYAQSIPVLVDASAVLRVERGMVIVWGRNGSGKSTLLRVLAGIEPVDGGAASFKGRRLEGRVRLLRQNPYESVAPSLTVTENVMLALARGERWRRASHSILQKEAVRLLGSLPGADSLKGAHDRAVAHLSGGQAQLVALTCAVADDSEIIIGDEPTKQLDPENRRRVHTMLHGIAKDRLVIVSSHSPRLDLAPPESHILVEGHKLHVGCVHAADGERDVEG